MYSFDKKTGILQAAQYRSGSPGEDYLTVYGDGSSLSGVAGLSAGTNIRPATSLPSMQCGLTLLLSVTGNGSVMISYRIETLALRNGESRVNVARRGELHPTFPRGPAPPRS
ncbi:hypothetical protein [Methanoregula sp.]|uniref:hypothetical protein n=1 Tax=Methanoregula sp. TaxID=2052170 RepID=UPI003569FD8F